MNRMCSGSGSATGRFLVYSSLGSPGFSRGFSQFREGGGEIGYFKLILEENENMSR